MPGRHIRYNVTGKYFEWSETGTATGPWTILDLSGNVVVTPLPTDIVRGPTSAINDNVAAFSGTTGKLIKDSLIPSAQVARKDNANNFSVNQIVNKAQASFEASQGTAKARLHQALDGTVSVSSNLYYNGTVWVSDDVAKYGSLFHQPGGGSGFTFFNSLPSANPRTLINLASLNDAGFTLSAVNSFFTGNGLVFPAVQVAHAGANALDDYEEGAWTPYFTGSAGGYGGQTYGIQSATYVKIGRKVLVNFDLQVLAVGSYPVAGTAYVAGLPFLIGPAVTPAAPLGYYAGWTGGWYQLEGLGVPNNGHMVLYYHNALDGTMHGALSTANVVAGTRVLGMMFYMATS